MQDETLDMHIYILEIDSQALEPFW